MLAITDLKNGTKFIFSGDPYVVLNYSQSKMGRGGSVVKVKIKNLKTGATLSKTFQGTEKFEPADLVRKNATYLYTDDADTYFMDATTFDQFSLPLSQIGEEKKFLVENTPVDIIYFKDAPINIDLPIKMNFKVTSAPPAVKGNSAGAITKKIVLSTGAEIDAPIFIKEDDTIVVDTRTGTYVERG
jgi:elongation factor P